MQQPNARERRVGMAAEMRKVEEVREALLVLHRIARSYPPGHEMRARLESMDMERVLDAVEDDISTRRSDLLHPGGT